MAPFDKHFIILLEVLCLPIGIWVLIKIDIPKSNRAKVFIMYAGSLIKTFKSTPGSSFQKETRYGYQGMRFSNLNRQGSYTLRSGQTIYGEPIFFSHTILDTSRNIDGSVAFVKFLLLENGQQLFKNDGLNPIKARIERDFEKIPSVIKSVLLEIRVEQ